MRLPGGALGIGRHQPLAPAPPPRPVPPAAAAPAPGIRVVHGTGRVGPQAWAHAWGELPSGLVFCGVRQAFYEGAGSRRVLGATATAAYRPAAAAGAAAGDGALRAVAPGGPG